MNGKFFWIDKIIGPNSTSSYRLISAFGRSTIRKFSSDVSAMKKLAARDFEDLLQVRIDNISSFHSTDRLNLSARSRVLRNYFPNLARK